jgi:putative transposase
VAKWKKHSHVLYQCSYHIVWCPKYRYRILAGEVGQYVDKTIRILCEWKDAEIMELNVREDHVHLVVEMPPRESVSDLMGLLKGKTAIKLFKSYQRLRKKPYWGNHFWARGYCVSTVGMDEEKIRKYVKYQEEKEREEENEQQQCGLF